MNSVQENTMTTPFLADAEALADELTAITVATIKSTKKRTRSAK